MNGRIVMSEAGRRVNVTRPLTRSLDLGEEGLAMQATRICSVDDCQKPVKSRNLCSTHASRLARTGTTAARVSAPVTHEQDLARFWSKVDHRGDDDCWPWLGTVLDNGYGQFAAQGRRHLAHRFAYEVSVGPIPAGYEVDHVWARGCTRTDCVNPAHLEAVTPAENKLRSNNVAGVNSRKVTCRYGHPYRVARDGTRFCPTCKADWERRRKRVTA